VTFHSERQNPNCEKYIESPSILYNISPQNNPKPFTQRLNKEKISSNLNNNNSEYFIENLESKFSLGVKIDEGIYDVQLTGNFNDNSNKLKLMLNNNIDNSENLNVHKYSNTENCKIDSFKFNENLLKSCFFCERNKIIPNNSNSENEKSIQETNKNIDESLTEKLKILMKSFNIERRFSDKLEENKDFNNCKENLAYKNELKEISSFNFTNYYPKNLSYILLDLRISLDKKDKFYDYKAGFLPMTVVIEQEELCDDYVNIKNNFNLNF